MSVRVTRGHASPRRNLVAHLAAGRGKHILIDRSTKFSRRLWTARPADRWENEAIELAEGQSNRSAFQQRLGATYPGREWVLVTRSISIRIALVHPRRLIQVNIIFHVYAYSGIAGRRETVCSNRARHWCYCHRLPLVIILSRRAIVLLARSPPTLRYLY